MNYPDKITELLALDMSLAKGHLSRHACSYVPRQASCHGPVCLPSVRKLYALLLRYFSVFTMLEVVFGWHLPGEATKQIEPGDEMVIVCVHFARGELEPC